MLPLYSPRDEVELLILRSILDDAGLCYFVHNETFGSLYMGAPLEAYNRKTLCVPDAEADEARALLTEYLQRTGRGGEVPDDPEEHAQRHASWLLRWLDGLLHRWRASEAQDGRTLRVIRNEQLPAAPRRRRHTDDRQARPRLRLVHGFRPRERAEEDRARRQTGSGEKGGAGTGTESR